MREAQSSLLDYLVKYQSSVLQLKNNFSFWKLFSAIITHSSFNPKANNVHLSLEDKISIISKILSLKYWYHLQTSTKVLLKLGSPTDRLNNSN